MLNIIIILLFLIKFKFGTNFVFDLYLKFLIFDMSKNCKIEQVNNISSIESDKLDLEFSKVKSEKHN